MPLISRIGRKHPKIRALHACIYALLILGSITMVYPFLIMISGSMKSAVDIKEIDIWPRFLTDDTGLYQKHIEGLFNERLAIYQTIYNTDHGGFEHATLPSCPPAQIQDWEGFIARKPPAPTTYTIGYIEANVSKTLPLLLRRFKQEQIETFEGDIAAMNQALETEFVNWNAFFLLPEDYLLRRNTPQTTAFARAFDAFKARQEPAYRYYFSLNGYYVSRFLKTQYTKDIADYNASHGTRFQSYDEVRLSQTLPSGTDPEKADWESFVRNSLNLLWIRVDHDAAPAFQAFLAAKHGSIRSLNRRYGTEYPDFDSIPFAPTVPTAGIPLSDWNAFVRGWKDPDTGILHQPTATQLRIEGIDFDYRDFLASRYPAIGDVNLAYGSTFSGFDEIPLPQPEIHAHAFAQRRTALRKEFVLRNFITVIDYMLLHGRGIVNTVIYCLLAVLASLIVNPMAAYAMSRYRLPRTYAILLFMLLTMAFPPMVTQIPVFLMLRDLQLLNTFAALVLPALAHGYSIFLLKGFFDSLPRELYETSEIDGANEWTMFWHITMSLSKPILAVTALHAFTLAYSNFMFALLICQDERMWTLMVWLYQLQQRSGQAVMYASLLIASVPTFIIFLFCQNIIMRGIVVPVEK